MNLTIRQLEVLVAVGDTLSLTAAAGRLGISQPAVSETLKRVELELGCRLLDRRSRNVTLTVEGKHIVATSREAIRALAGTFEAIASRGEGVRGRVALAALPSITCAMLPPVLSEFKRNYPLVEISVHDALQTRATGLLKDGVVDFAIAGKPPPDPMISYEEIAGDDVSLIVSQCHRFAGRQSLEWSELANENFIAMSSASSVRSLTDAAFCQAKVEVMPTLEVGQISCAAALVAAELGVAVLPSMTLAMFDNSNIVVIPLTSPTIRRSVGIMQIRDRPISISAVRFLNIFRRSNASPR